MIRTRTKVAGVEFTADGRGWMAQIGRIGISVEVLPSGTWRWDLNGAKSRKRWWGTAGTRYRAMMLAVRHAKRAA